MKNLFLNIRSFLLLIIALVIFLNFYPNSDSTFKTDQLKNPRVKNAYKEKENLLKELYKAKGVNFTSQQIYLRAFKKEESLELWARSTTGAEFVLIKSFDICSSSGTLGPKRKQGDGQTPEGFYHIDRFNPNSLFHLSLGLNYPNRSDILLIGNHTNSGGDIFIHGNCVTIGCLPITDDKIKELYIAAVEAKSNGQKTIQVHIFPCKLSEGNFRELKSKYANDLSLLTFWSNLKTGYDYFEQKKILPNITINKSGKYEFK